VKAIFSFLVIMLSFITTSYAQVMTSNTRSRAGDGTAPISTGTNASSATISDIAAAYNAAEQNIELAFGKLTQSANNNIDGLREQIEELKEKSKELKDAMDKLSALQKKMADLGQLIQQLNQENKNAIQNLEKQKINAIGQANELIKQKRSQDIPFFLQTIKIQTVKDGQDSLQSINSRYQIANH
jgi:predicted  nucleic acid-binding Zn-ribbon protein